MHHRFTRLHAPAGPLTVHYRARVRRSASEADTSAGETPIAELPDDLMHNLMPMRYCESDLLSRLGADDGHEPRIQAAPAHT